MTSREARTSAQVGAGDRQPGPRAGAGEHDAVGVDDLRAAEEPQRPPRAGLVRGGEEDLVLDRARLVDDGEVARLAVVAHARGRARGGRRATRRGSTRSRRRRARARARPPGRACRSRAASRSGRPACRRRRSRRRPGTRSARRAAGGPCAGGRARRRRSRTRPTSTAGRRPASRVARADDECRRRARPARRSPGRRGRGRRAASGAAAALAHVAAERALGQHDELGARPPRACASSRAIRARSSSTSRPNGAATAAITGMAHDRRAGRAPVWTADQHLCSAMARLLSVNVGRPQQLSVRRGRPLMSAIGKAPVEGRVRVAGVNLEGDDQADRRVHGGPDKAVYAYARRGHGVLGGRARPRARAGRVRREPDHRGPRRQRRGRRRALADRRRRARGRPAAAALRQARAADGRADDGQALRAGVAARARTCGSSARASWAPATRSRSLSRPEHGVTVRDVSDAILLDEALLARAAAAPELPADLAEWMRSRAA